MNLGVPSVFRNDLVFLPVIGFKRSSIVFTLRAFLKSLSFKYCELEPSKARCLLGGALLLVRMLGVPPEANGNTNPVIPGCPLCA